MQAIAKANEGNTNHETGMNNHSSHCSHSKHSKQQPPEAYCAGNIDATERLQVGDEVALIAPASGQKHDEQSLIEDAVAWLSAQGLRVVIRPAVGQAVRYLSASDQQRADELLRALQHPNVKAIFVTRGGFGCARLLSLLDEVCIPTPRYLVGFSDIVTLHLHFICRQTPNLRCIHAPNLATQQFLADNADARQNREALAAALFHGHFPDLPLMPLVLPSSVSLASDWQSAPRVGGCLSLLVSTLGTAHAINTEGKTLLIEDVSEAPYKIDRMLTHLRNAGKFDHLKAVIIGDCVGCHSPNIALNDVLKDCFADADNIDFPVWLTQSFGHGRLNLPWVYG